MIANLLRAADCPREKGFCVKKTGQDEVGSTCQCHAGIFVRKFYVFRIHFEMFIRIPE